MTSLGLNNRARSHYVHHRFYQRGVAVCSMVILSYCTAVKVADCLTCLAAEEGRHLVLLLLNAT
jgi:hypothetical protein